MNKIYPYKTEPWSSMGVKNSKGLFNILWNAVFKNELMGRDEYIIKQYGKMLMTEFRWWAYDVYYKILSIFCIFIIFHNKI